MQLDITCIWIQSTHIHSRLPCGIVPSNEDYQGSLKVLPMQACVHVPSCSFVAAICAQLTQAICVDTMSNLQGDVSEAVQRELDVEAARRELDVVVQNLSSIAGEFTALLAMIADARDRMNSGQITIEDGNDLISLAQTRVNVLRPRMSPGPWRYEYVWP